MLRQMPAEGIDCCLTSPPYYGLRDYGTGEWIGGRPDCDHAAAKKKTRYDYSLATSPVQEARPGTDAVPHLFMESCPSCGARRQDEQLGLEATPEEYVSNIADVFDEVRRVMKPAGTLFLNIGDSYIDADLLGVPWMVAFELKRRGWILRGDVIWAKSQVMPESAKNRPTKAHEYVFFLTKKRTDYYYNWEASLEQAQWERWGRQTQPKGAGWIPERSAAELSERNERNLRSVWFLGTAAYPEAHFAVMPEELAGICLAIGCPPGGIVLDPFFGTGTTALVARRYGQRTIGIELNPESIALAEKRLAQQSLFTEVA